MSTIETTSYDNKRRIETTYALIFYGFDFLKFPKQCQSQELKPIYTLVFDAKTTLHNLRTANHNDLHTAPLLLQLDLLSSALEILLNRDQIERRSRLAGWLIAQYQYNRPNEWTADYENNKPTVADLIKQLQFNPNNNQLLIYAGCIEFARLLWKDDLQSYAASDEIVREIRFKPEHQQAMIAILSYFSVILRQRLPGSKATVSIRQEGDRVILTIGHLDGHTEEISKVLSEYGLVVAGEQNPESLLSDPLHVVALRQKLEIAALELRQTRELLMIERSTSKHRIKLIEEEVKYMKEQLAQALDGERQLRANLFQLFTSAIGPNQPTGLESTMNKLIDALVARDEEATRSQMDTLSRDQPDLLERLHAYIFSSAFGGVVGNTTYDWLKLLWSILPK